MIGLGWFMHGVLPAAPLESRSQGPFVKPILAFPRR